MNGGSQVDHGGAAVRRPRMLDTLWQDVRFGARTLGRSPAFALVAVATLGLGIGANTAIFSVINGVLLRPLPLPEPDRLVHVWEVTERSGGVRVSGPNFLDWQARARSFTGLAAVTAPFPETVLGGSEPARVVLRGVSRDFFDVLGVQPVRGRAIAAEENRPGGAPTVVVSDGLWRRLLGSDPALGERTLEFFGTVYTVVGVMPPGFEFIAPTDVFYPVERSELGGRTAHNFQVVARLRDGVTAAQAQQEMHAIAAGLREEHGEQTDAVSASVVGLQEQLVGSSRRPLLLLLGAAALVLLVACTNLASTLLARGTARQRELAVRAAVGAGRWRIIRQLLTESALLSLLGSAAGLVLAVLVLRGLVALGPSALPRLGEIGVDGRVLAFTFAAALMTAVAFGLLPALRLSRADVYDRLRDGGRGTGDRGRRRAWAVLVAAEVALAVVLLAGSGLLIKSFWTVLRVDPGYDAEGVLTVEVSVPASHYANGEPLAGFHRSALAEVRSAPGVSAAGLVNNLPLVGFNLNGGFAIRGGAEESGYASYRVVDAGYFAAMGIPLLRGRSFDERDREGAPHAVVVNQTFAERYSPDRDPMGMQLRPYGMDLHSDEWLTVVGVVGDIRHSDLTAEVRPEIFVHVEQRPERARGAFLVVRTAAQPSRLVPVLRDRLTRLDANVPVEFATMQTHISRSVADRRFSMLVLAAFAAAALLLAAVGIYGVVSYSVAQRTREIGIRIALGASPGRVRRGVLWDALRTVAAGAAAGSGAALLLTRALERMLYEVSATDPMVLAAVVGVLLGAAGLASFVPAQRSTRVDPVEAIRGE